MGRSWQPESRRAVLRRARGRLRPCRPAHEDGRGRPEGRVEPPIRVTTGRGGARRRPRPWRVDLAGSGSAPRASQPATRPALRAERLLNFRYHPESLLGPIPLFSDGRGSLTKRAGPWSRVPQPNFQFQSKTRRAYERVRVRARSGRAGTERGWRGRVPGVPEPMARAAASAHERRGSPPGRSANGPRGPWWRPIGADLSADGRVMSSPRAAERGGAGRVGGCAPVERGMRG